jgi:uncharacterized protein
MSSSQLFSALLLVLLSACAGSPQVQYYVLEPLSQPAPLSIGTEKQLSIGIGPISVPALLDRKKIITRTSSNNVQISESQQWATSLEDSLLQTVTNNLTTLRPANIVRAYPWSVHGPVDLQIIVDFVRFDTTPGKSVNLEAKWAIKNESTPVILKNGRSVITHPLDDSSYPGTVRALSKILGQFSQELSLAIRQVEAKH